MEGNPEGAKVVTPPGGVGVYICPILHLSSCQDTESILRFIFSFLTALEENKISLNARISFLEPL